MANKLLRIPGQMVPFMFFLLHIVIVFVYIAGFNICMYNFSVGQHFVPLVITMVGLPARGKTILAYKIQQYLNWTNHKAKGM